VRTFLFRNGVVFCVAWLTSVAAVSQNTSPLGWEYLKQGMESNDDKTAIVAIAATNSVGAVSPIVEKLTQLANGRQCVSRPSGSWLTFACAVRNLSFEVVLMTPTLQ